MEKQESSSTNKEENGSVKNEKNDLLEKEYSCPWCGGKVFTYGVQTNDGRIRPAKKMTFIQENLIHIICRKCGSIVRSYVEHPEKF